MAMIEKKGKFELRLRPSRANYIGAVLSLIGFVLTLLCLVGSRHPSGKSLHFIKLTDNPPGSLGLYVGWQGYCVDDQGSTECHTDDGVMQAPFDVVIATKFNHTYPQMFENPVELDQDLYPLAQPNPVHNPKVYAASMLCLLSGGAAFVVGLLVILLGYRFPDTHYSRGFFAWGASVLALLLIAQSCVLYQDGAEMLNLTYPHLIASLGPGLPLIGVAFACFTIAGFAYLHGCFNKDEAIEGGYSAL